MPKANTRYALPLLPAAGGAARLADVELDLGVVVARAQALQQQRRGGVRLLLDREFLERGLAGAGTGGGRGDVQGGFRPEVELADFHAALVLRSRVVSPTIGVGPPVKLEKASNAMSKFPHEACIGQPRRTRPLGLCESRSIGRWSGRDPRSRWGRVGRLTAFLGTSATSRIEVVSVSSWKCGRR